ncbi:MAG: Wzt carbohydrate-binding domain-containing protein [Bryobacteraceae bacterium]
MAIEFRGVHHTPLMDFSAHAPEGAIIGVIGENNAGAGALLRLAAGLERPETGEVLAPENRRWIGAGEALNLSPVDVLVLDQALARHDALERERTVYALEGLRRAGATVLLATHEAPLIERLCDELWWIHEGRMAARGDPRETLAKYRQHVAARIREWGGTLHIPLNPTLRRGDHRAEIVSLETLGAGGEPTLAWTSGEQVAVRVSLRFLEAVREPVVGIMIRSRIGFEVYGTNTELERTPIGPCAGGETVSIVFRFACELCPRDYTLTAASHDPDGAPHDWLDDAVAFTVVDSRETAGVANLRARVTVERRVP